MKAKRVLLYTALLLSGMSVWANNVLSCDVYDDYDDCSKNGYNVGRAYAPADVLAVDLGLPSGVKWASCNVGAEKPEDDGFFYAWGEVWPKGEYFSTTYKYANGGEYKLTKYCGRAEQGDNGFTDTKTILEPGDDAARFNWGGNWRMPTYKEWKELVDNCKWTWTQQNGVQGYRVASEVNENSIFLPASGIFSQGSRSSKGSLGIYWSSSLDKDFPKYAYAVRCASNLHDVISYTRYLGHTVRPVCMSQSDDDNFVTLTLYTAGCEHANIITCNAGQQVEVSAVPENKYRRFVRWSDGNTDNPRLVTITNDTTLTAVFAFYQYTVGISAEDGTIEGGGMYDHNSTATLTAIADKHYHFTQWSDGNTDNPRLVTVTQDTIFTAEFAVNIYTIMVEYDNMTGFVSGSGTFQYGQPVRLEASPNSGYKFLQWSNGITRNPYLFTAEEDVTLVAQFIPATAVENVSAEGTTPHKIIRNGQVLILRNGKVYDVMGQEVK